MSVEVDRWLVEHAAALGINPANVGPHSVDVRLGHTIIEKKMGRPDIRYTLAPGEAFEFVPGSFYLADTIEYLHIPTTHRGQLVLKSSTARRGLQHLMAGYLDAGFEGTVTLELVAYLPVTFRAGDRIAQIEFARLSAPPERPYTVTGRYNGQRGPQEALPEREPVGAPPVTVEDRAALRLHPDLAEAMQRRAAYGRKKYGQSLADNAQPFRGKLVHLMQELLDAVAYAEWAEQPGYAYLIAELANDLHDEYGLTPAEIMAGGKH